MRVLYFDLDCIRNDHLGCYGYHRPISPTIDSIAAEGVRFTDCYCSNSPCNPSRAALFSGRFGRNNGVVANSPPGDRWRPNRGTSKRTCPTWMRQLRAQGDMHTVSFSNFADRHGSWWFHNGFSEFHTVNLKSGFETADEVHAVANPWLKQHARRDNWFVHVHTWDIHFPYRLPDMHTWLDTVSTMPPPAWPDDELIRAQYAHIYGSRTARDLWGGNNYWVEKYPVHPKQVANREDLMRLINGYDASIMYVDRFIGRALDILKQQGVYEDTAVIISGDHGDNFGECGGHYMDHTTASDPVMRRPLIIKWPGVTPSGAVSNALLYQLDLCPTTCELLGYESPDVWDGQSFAAALRGGPYGGRESLVLDHGMSSLQRAVRTRDWYSIHTLSPGNYPIDDPVWLHEARFPMQPDISVAGHHPHIVEEHRAIMHAWESAQAARSGWDDDPLREMAREMNASPVDEKTAGMFAADGREHLIDEIHARRKRYAAMLERESTPQS